jgi:hypothetical protein
MSCSCTNYFAATVWMHTLILSPHGTKTIWVRSTIHKISVADRVLIIISPEYKRWFERATPSGIDRGIRHEASFVLEHLYSEEQTDIANLSLYYFRAPVGFQKSVTAAEHGLNADRSYSLIKPPRTGRHLIRS